MRFRRAACTTTAEAMTASTNPSTPTTVQAIHICGGGGVRTSTRRVCVSE